MSTLKNPVGPQSSKVYWRRRLVVGLGLIAVIVVIILIVVRPGSSSGEPNPTTPAAPSTSATPGATDAANPTVVPTKDTTVEGKACKPANVQVTAITDHDHYAAGENPQLQMSIVNMGTKACVFNVGTSKQVYTISSGAETYWVSTDCQTDAVDAQMTLRPGVPVGTAAAITWDRTRSSPDTCSEARDAVTAGGASYHLVVSVDGVKSESTQFILD